MYYVKKKVKAFSSAHRVIVCVNMCLFQCGYMSTVSVIGCISTVQAAVITIGISLYNSMILNIKCRSVLMSFLFYCLFLSF